ncbi:MAG: preprotein translocase subunit YajC [Actinomycetota bacterium]
MIEILLASESSSSDNGSPLFTLVFFGAIFGAMYFLLLRPQRRRLKESQALQSSLAVNDEVVLNSGIYGFISAIEDDVLWVDIADGHGSERIEVRVARGSVARKIVETPESDSKKK